MERKNEPISEVVKRTSSISEVAERLGISRPTLYKYMDFYDNGEFARIPDNVLHYLQVVSDDSVPADRGLDSRQIKEMMRSIEEDRTLHESKMAYLDLISSIATNDRGRRQRGMSPSWSDGPVPTMCVPNGNGATVFFKGALEGTTSTTVVVSITVDDESTPIGRYVPDEGRGFVNIDDLPSGLAYIYQVEQVRGGVTTLSSPGQLILR